ncbi:MAG TPA: hypothetical protein VGC78_06700 [Gaiellaceae bacterium]|jgi:hypothetical protein
MSNYYEGGRVEDAPLGREGQAEAETMYAPPQHYAPQGYGYGYGYGMRGMPRLRRQYPIETKPFFLTSEFAAAVVAVVALAITAAASDTIDAWRFWLLATGITCAYLLSRGIAKSGTRSNATDPREQLDLTRRGDRGEHDHH